MSPTVIFYLARAAENAKAARDTSLVQVRERCLRAEAAWRAMAEKLTRFEDQRQRDALAKERLSEVDQ